MSGATLVSQPNIADNFNMDSTLAWVNGEAADHVAVGDRGFNYGHGLFETMRIAEGVVPLWPWHQRRLCADAIVLGIEVDEQRLAQYLRQALAAAPAEGVLKLTLTAGNASSGYRNVPSAADNITYCLQFRALPAKRAPLRLQPCQYRLPDNTALAGIKHLNRLDQVIAARELPADHEGLLLDSEGAVIEALSNNLFCLLDGTWLTPDLSRCGVKGVMREYLRAEVFPALGLAVEEARFGLEDLARAEAVLVCNSVRGIESVSSIIGCGEWSCVEAVESIRAQLNAQVPCFNC